MPLLRKSLPDSRRFRTDAMVAFVFVVVLLTVGMGLGLREVEHVTRDQLAHVQSEEYEITLVERLRWSAELLVSAGRGYLISTGSIQHANLELAKREFDSAVHALEQTELSPRGVALVEDANRAAMKFEGIQEQLVEQRDSAELSTMADRFETELLPARVELQRALDRLVGHKTAVIENLYASAKQQRRHLMRWVNALLAALAIGSLGIGFWSAKRLARTYRREADARETAQRAVSARDELMAIVAHDLRSPLGAITMRAEHLRETTSDPTAREQAALINNTASRMAHLIKTMVDVKVAEVGQLSVRKAPCDVDRLVREAVDIVSAIATSKGLELEHRIAQPGLVVFADRERIFPVLSTLLGNAIKFTPTGGRVTLSAEQSGDFVTFAVSDNGPGIEAADLPRVFDRYWRADARTTKGTGLGLFIAKSIIDAHGGRISVESTPGQGATFWFTLQAAKHARPGAARG